MKTSLRSHGSLHGSHHDRHAPIDHFIPPRVPGWRFGFWLQCGLSVDYDPNGFERIGQSDVKPEANMCEDIYTSWQERCLQRGHRTSKNHFACIFCVCSCMATCWGFCSCGPWVLISLSKPELRRPKRATAWHLILKSAFHSSRKRALALTQLAASNLLAMASNLLGMASNLI